MKLIISTIILFCCTSLVKPDVIYLDPAPDAKYVSIYNNLIIGMESPINESLLAEVNITVTGSKSGLHTYDVKLTSDGKKILFRPQIPFRTNETVTVQVSSNNNQIKFNSRKDFSYRFTTEAARIPISGDKSLRDELGDYYRAPFELDNADPPELTVTISNNPSPGRLFVSSYNTDPSYLIIAENNANIYWSKGFGNQTLDFKVQSNGTLTYYLTGSDKFFQMNDNYEVIDSFACGNGYTTDTHEFILLPNGHSLLMAYDPQIVDMSQIVAGGDTAATVIGLIIQELDESKNVVFQWRSWDHFEITDATSLDLTSSTIDYVHGNAIDMDTDGNLLISSRHMDEITKIDRVKGSIIWRLGGIHNQFTFKNDSLGFFRQHCIRRIANGNITLFDNGNFHSPQFSRAVEYNLDEIGKTVTLVWEYRNNPTIYGFAMGSVQRLENGNTLIGWGFTTPALSEVTPDGKVALEMKFPGNIVSYRAFKFNWDNITSTGSNSGLVPESYSLAQNYPNPFNPVTSISYSIPVAGNVSIRVYDMMGREIKSLVSEYKQAGSYNILFDASNFASGVYLYKLEAGSYIASRKMVLIK
ncbi:MAG: aryl-sulfate sulfotransferase [Ignavibacteriae bacterium]|nr:aryl-sulfate sulfotransferase [Ignavibacteriota bacterium]MCB9243042.1 aryl-sulfate sulfotransferase [Ignavibacteriales bacterium]